MSIAGGLPLEQPLGAVGVEPGDDVDRPLVEELRDRRVLAVRLGQAGDQPERDVRADDVVRLQVGHQQERRLRGARAGAADGGDPDVAALAGRRQRPDGDRAGVVPGDLAEGVGQARVIEVAGREGRGRLGLLLDRPARGRVLGPDPRREADQARGHGQGDACGEKTLHAGLGFQRGRGRVVESITSSQDKPPAAPRRAPAGRTLAETRSGRPCRLGRAEDLAATVPGPARLGQAIRGKTNPISRRSVGFPRPLEITNPIPARWHGSPERGPDAGKNEPNRRRSDRPGAERTQREAGRGIRVRFGRDGEPVERASTASRPGGSPPLGLLSAKRAGSRLIFRPGRLVRTHSSPRTA